MVLQNYQNFIEITANMIYLVALGLGLKCLRKVHLNTQCTEVRFASWLPGGFTTMAVINPPERKLTNRTSVDWSESSMLPFFKKNKNQSKSQIFHRCSVFYLLSGLAVKFVTTIGQ